MLTADDLAELLAAEGEELAVAVISELEEEDIIRVRTHWLEVFFFEVTGGGFANVYTYNGKTYLLENALQCTYLIGETIRLDRSVLIGNIYTGIVMSIYKVHL